MPSPATRPSSSGAVLKMNAPQRRAIRHRVHSPAYASIEPARKGAMTDLNAILDISEEGMAIQNLAPLEVSRWMTFSLDLSETRTRILVPGVVVWSDKTGKAGIRFEDVSEASRIKLKEWLFLNLLSAISHYGPEDRIQAAAEAGAAPVAVDNVWPIDAPTIMENDSEPEHYRNRARGDDHAEMLTALDSIKREVEGRGQNADAALQLIVERAVSFTPATGAAIAIASASDVSPAPVAIEEMVCRASAGDDAPGVGTRLKIGSGFSGECVRTGKMLYCVDSETDPRVDQISCRALGVRSIVALPIRSGRAVIGLLEVFSPLANAFSATECSALMRLGDIASFAIERAGFGLPRAQRRSIARQVIPYPSVELPKEDPAAQEKPSSPPASAPALREPAVREPAARVREREGAATARPVSSAPAAVSATASSPLIEEYRHQLSLAEEAERSANALSRIADLKKLSPRRLLLLGAAAVTLLGVSAWLITSLGKTSPRTDAAGANAARAGSTASGQPAHVYSGIDEIKSLAGKGDSAAQFSLGVHYATGEQVPQDYKEAAKWFSMAAEQGQVMAQSTLGAYYWAGRGVPQDIDKAYFWAVLAKTGGDEASRARVAFLASRMSRAEVLAAQQRAGEWIKEHQQIDGGASVKAQ